MDLQGLALGPGAVDLGGQGARRVEDDEVALVEEAGELGEMGMHERSVAFVRHEHPHRIAGHAPGLRRRGRLQLGGQGERQRAQHREGPAGALRQGSLRHGADHGTLEDGALDHSALDHGVPQRGHAVTSAPTSSLAR